MLHWLKRHQMPIKTFMDFTLGLTFALPRAALEPLLAPGLTLDTHEDYGLMAIAMVQSRGLRPAFLPPVLGIDFFLTGYRIFTRYTSASGRTLRGLQILRSDTDQRLMVWLGNMLTGYNYRKAEVTIQCVAAGRRSIHVRTPGSEADLILTADFAPDCPALPHKSPFKTEADARRYSGPLPYTFNYEHATHSMVIIRGVRQEWRPRLITVDLQRATYFDQPRFRGFEPVLASAFCVEGVPYRWERGVLEHLPG